MYNFLPVFFFFHCSVVGYFDIRDHVSIKLLPYWSDVCLGSDLCTNTEMEQQITKLERK